MGVGARFIWGYGEFGYIYSSVSFVGSDGILVLLRGIRV